MRQAAHELEEKLEPAPANLAAGYHKHILVCLTGRPSSAMLILRVRRVADYLQAGCVALDVSTAAGMEPMDETVKRHMSSRNLRIDTHIVSAGNVSGAIADFARSQGVTQIFMRRSAPLS